MVPTVNIATVYQFHFFPLCIIIDKRSAVKRFHKIFLTEFTSKNIKLLVYFCYYFPTVLGDFHCPVTYKVFTKSSHIVAVKPSGNVYAYEAIDELNLKPRFMKDLLTDQPFTKSDIITIQVSLVFLKVVFD